MRFFNFVIQNWYRCQQQHFVGEVCVCVCARCSGMGAHDLDATWAAEGRRQGCTVRPPYPLRPPEPCVHLRQVADGRAEGGSEHSGPPRHDRAPALPADCLRRGAELATTHPRARTHARTPTCPHTSRTLSYTERSRTAARMCGSRHAVETYPGPPRPRFPELVPHANASSARLQAVLTLGR